MNVLGLGGIGDGALQHGYQLLWIRRLVADAHRHDHLVIAIDGCLAVVALQQVAVAFHEVAAWIRVVPLRSGCGTAIGPMGQAGNDDGPGRLRNNEYRIASTQHRSKAGFINEELGEIGERHRFFRRRRNRPEA